MGAKHTPTPWGLSYGFDLGGGRLGAKSATYIAGPNPEAIGIKLASPWREGAWDGDPEADANAEFIVRAVNSHDELVEALQRLLSAVEVMQLLRGPLGEGLRGLAHSALSKAINQAASSDPSEGTTAPVVEADRAQGGSR